MVPPRARGPVLVMFSIKSNLRKDSCSEFGVGKKLENTGLGGAGTHMHVNTEEALIRHQQPWGARRGGRARGELRPASGARNRKPMAPSAVPACGDRTAPPDRRAAGPARHPPTRWVRETRNAENNWTRASTQRKTVHVYDKSAPQNFGCTGRGESVLAIMNQPAGHTAESARGRPAVLYWTDVRRNPPPPSNEVIAED